MPNNDMDALRKNMLKHLEKFPKVLEPYLELVQKLKERYTKKNTKSPGKILENWKSCNKLEKFYFLGWFRAAIKKLGVTGTMRYLTLKEKQHIDEEMALILDSATEEELKAFRDGEDSIFLHK